MADGERLGEAFIELHADASAFEDELESAIRDAVRTIERLLNRNLQRTFDDAAEGAAEAFEDAFGDVEDDVKDLRRDVGREFERLGDDIEDSLEDALDGDLFDDLGGEAREARREVGREFERLEDDITESLGDPIRGDVFGNLEDEARETRRQVGRVFEGIEDDIAESIGDPTRGDVFGRLEDEAREARREVTRQFSRMELDLGVTMVSVADRWERQMRRIEDAARDTRRTVGRQFDRMGDDIEGAFTGGARGTTQGVAAAGGGGIGAGTAAVLAFGDNVAGAVPKLQSLAGVMKVFGAVAAVAFPVVLIKQFVDGLINVARFAGQASAALARFGLEATLDLLEVNKQVGLLSTVLGQQFVDEIGGAGAVTDLVQEIGEAVGRSTDLVAEVLFIGRSVGVAVDELDEFAQLADTFALATGQAFEEAGNQLAALQGASGAEGFEELADVLDRVFTAAAGSRTTAAEILQVLLPISAITEGAAIGLTEAAVAIAQLNTRGQESTVAATNLKALAAEFQNLEGPLAEFLENTDALGGETIPQFLRNTGDLPDLFRIIQRELKATDKDLAEVFASVEARAAIGTLIGSGTGLEGFEAEVAKALGADAAGATQAAADIGEQFGQGFVESFVAAVGRLREDIGEALLPGFQIFGRDLIDVIEAARDALGRLIDGIDPQVLLDAYEAFKESAVRAFEDVKAGAEAFFQSIGLGAADGGQRLQALVEGVAILGGALLEAVGILTGAVFAEVGDVLGDAPDAMGAAADEAARWRDRVSDTLTETDLLVGRVERLNEEAGNFALDASRPIGDQLSSLPSTDLLTESAVSNALQEERERLAEIAQESEALRQRIIRAAVGEGELVTFRETMEGLAVAIKDAADSMARLVGHIDRIVEILGGGPLIEFDVPGVPEGGLIGQFITPADELSFGEKWKRIGDVIGGVFSGLANHPLFAFEEDEGPGRLAQGFGSAVETIGEYALSLLGRFGDTREGIDGEWDTMAEDARRGAKSVTDETSIVAEAFDMMRGRVSDAIDGLGRLSLASAGRGIVSSLFAGLSAGFGGSAGFGASIGSQIGNAIIGVVARVLQQIEDAINRAISIVNQIPGVQVGKVAFKQPRPTANRGNRGGGGGGVRALADGGIVTGPTLALFGEAGDEAVIPLDGPQVRPFARAVAEAITGEGGTGGGGGGGRTVNVTQNITAPGRDPEVIAERVLHRLTRAGGL